MSKLNIKVKRLFPAAKLPAKAYNTDAGWDLYCAEDTGLIIPGEARAIRTGIAFEIPAGWYGQIFCRSGLAKRGMVVSGGVLDATFRGEIMVVAMSHSYHLMFGAGERIAQVVFLPVPEVSLEEVEVLGESQRGQNGFGSSGR